MSEKPRLSDAVARGTSRRGFLARVGAVLVGTASAGAVGGSAMVDEAEARRYNFCGHTYTTGNCPHPTGLPRIDRHGYPLRARDGKPVDDLGRPIDHAGRPLDGHGRHLRDANGAELPPAPRSRLCLDAIPDRFGIPTHVDGTWHRCCGGHVRRLMDCCSYSNRRINGDGALTGYCYQGRKVFCVMYYDIRAPC